jgi:hypothetical protein
VCGNKLQEPKRSKIGGDGRYYMLKNFVIYALHTVLLG